MLNFVQRFVWEHPGWGLAYFAVFTVLVLGVLQIFFGDTKR